MKRTLLALSILAASFSVKAQGFGVHASAIFPTLASKDDGQKDDDVKSRVSWKAGLQASLPLGTSLSLVPQLNLVGKGAKWSDDDVEMKYKMTYLEVPLNIVFNAGEADAPGFFIGAGPSFGLGIGGKVEAEIAGQTLDADIRFDGKEGDTDDDNVHLKGLDFGVNVIAGYRLGGGLAITGNYNHSFSNIQVQGDTDNFIKNRYFGFGLSYWFGGK